MFTCKISILVSLSNNQMLIVQFMQEFVPKFHTQIIQQEIQQAYNEYHFRIITFNVCNKTNSN